MEKRKYSRIPDKAKIFYKSDYINQKDWSLGWINNISIGGAFLKMSRPLPVGSKINIKLSLELINKGTTVCNISATIIRLADPAVFGSGSAGIAFLKNTLGSEGALITKYVREKEETKDFGKARLLAKSGVLKTEKKFQKLMKEAIVEVDKNNSKKKGFLSRLFG